MWGFLTINKNTKFVLLSVHLSLQLFVFLSEVLPSMDGVRHLVQPAVRILQSLNCKFNQPYVLFSSPIPTYSAYFLSLFASSFINFYAVLSLQCGRVCQAFKCNPVTDSFTSTCCTLALSFSDPHSPSCEQCTHTHTHTALNIPSPPPLLVATCVQSCYSDVKPSSSFFCTYRCCAV